MEQAHNESKLIYLRSEFNFALRIMVGQGSVKERLRIANSQHLHKINRRPDSDEDFEEELAAEWSTIHQQLLKIDALNDEQASQLAEDIVRFYQKL